MKKLLLFTSLLLTFSSVKSQDCNGVVCIADPNIEQEELVICYRDLDQDTMQFTNPDCEGIESCINVCEFSEYTYITPYHLGSSFTWSVLGGQIISSSPLGSTVTILWDSVGSGTVSVIEQDSLLCSASSMVCVSIISKPIAGIISSVNSDTICQGSSIQFQGINLNNSTLSQADSCESQWTMIPDTVQFTYELQYLWDFGDGSTSIEKDPIHIFTSPGVYSVTVSISNACQCSDISTVDIIVVNTPGPSITTCVGPLCEGDTAEYCTDAFLPDWEIIGGTIFNSSLSSNCIAVVWDNTGNELNDGGGELLVGDLNSGCGSSKSFYSVPVVPQNPEIVGNNIVCPGTLESYSFECIPGVEYQWSITSTGWSMPLILGSTSESDIKLEFYQWDYNYTVQLTLDIFSSTLNCPLGQLVFDIDVLPTINNIWIDTEVCEGDLGTYYGSGTLYDWTIINGTAATNTSSTGFIDVAWNQGIGNGMIIVEPATNSNYCQSSKSFPVNINAIPEPAINILGDSLICPGETYIYYVEESNASSSENLGYNWVVTGGTTSVSFGDVTIITWDPSGPYSIDVTNQILEWPNCTSPIFTKSINIAVSPSPVISGSNTACLNSISSFDLTTPYPQWATIKWSVSDPVLGSVVSGQGTSQAQVEWGNQIGIGSTNVVVEVDVCGVMYSSSFTVTFNNQPISFSITNNPICSESDLSLNSTAGVGDYYWSFGDGTSSSQALPLKTYNEPGSYLVSLTFTDPLTQCVSSYSSVISVEGIIGSLLPEGTSFFCGSNTISQPLSISTISLVTPAIEWFYNGVSVSTSNTYSVSSIPPNHDGIGSYSVVLTDPNGCSNTLNVITIDTLDCSSGSGWCSGGSGCPPLVPLVYTSACNSGLGTMLFDFSSPNGSAVNWRVDNGPISSALSYSITFNESGIYNVKASDGCLLGIEQITVPLVVDLAYSVICDPSIGNQITYYFEDISSYLLGYGSATYFWDFGDGTTSSLHNPSHTFAVNGIYNVHLTVDYGGYICDKVISINVSDFSVSYSYSGLECEDTPTITFNSSTAPTAIAGWTWDFGDGAGSNRQSPRRTFNPAGTYVTSLLVSDVSGCLASASLPITIEQNPIINSVTSLGILCINDVPIDLTPMVSFTTLSGEIAVWTGPGIDYDPVTDIYYFKPMFAGGGTHELEVVVTDNNGCSDSVNIIGGVICPSKPKIFGESEYCYDPNSWNNYITLNTQSIFSTYNWFRDGANIGSGYNLYDYSSVGTYDYTIEVTDLNGCTVLSEPFSIVVNDIPNPVWVSVNTNPCPSEEIILSHGGNQSGVDYYWNTLPQQTAAAVIVNAIADYEYAVTAVNEHGCESISMWPITVPSKIPLCGVLSGCVCDDEVINSAGLINITGLNNSWIYSSYEWLLDGVSFPIPQTSTDLIIDPLDPNYLTICSGVITLEVTDNSSCTASSNPLVIEPNCLNCLGSANLEYNITETICLGDSIIVGDNTYASPGLYTDVLQATGGCDSIIILDLTVLPLPQNNQNIIICVGDSLVIGSNIYYDNGIYTDTFSSVVGCDSILITEVELSDPLVNLTFTGSVLNAFAVGGISPYALELGNQNGPILNSFNVFGSNSVSVNPISNGIYYCFVIDENNCISDTVFYQVDIFPSSLEEINIMDLFIFPNPARSVFNISFESINSQDFKVRLVNVIGEELVNITLEQFIGEYTKQINLSDNAKGIYFLEIETKEGMINRKLILQ